MKRALLCLLALCLISAKPTANPREDGAYGRAGKFGMGQIISGISTSGSFVPDTIGTTDVSATASPNLPHLFTYGTIVMVTCDVNATIFFLQDVGATTTAATGLVSDSGSTAGRTTGANGIRAWAGVTRHVVVPNVPVGGNEQIKSESQVSVRTSACVGATEGDAKDRATFGMPCDADADCLYSTGVTCETTEQPRGSYLKIHPSATAECSIEVEH